MTDCSHICKHYSCNYKNALIITINIDQLCLEINSNMFKVNNFFHYESLGYNVTLQSKDLWFNSRKIVHFTSDSPDTVTLQETSFISRFSWIVLDVADSPV